MKLEKREITLNEYDSIRDAFYMEKLLLNEYACLLNKAIRKETRGELLRLMKEVGEDMFFLCDLMKESVADGLEASAGGEGE